MFKVKKRCFFIILSLSFLIGLGFGILINSYAFIDSEPKIKVAKEPKTVNIVKDLEQTESTHNQTWEYLGEYTVTAYCSCEKYCGNWAKNGKIIGAYGKELIPNYSVASPLPYGTKIDIDGIGIRVIEDKTADWIVKKYDGKIIDLYFDDHAKALKFGCKKMVVWRLKGE